MHRLYLRLAVPVVFGLMVALVLIPGCVGQSLLITPVSTNRQLRETELSRESLFARDKIALVDVTGVLLNTPRRQLIGEGEHPVSLLLEQLDKARKDKHVKAVLLRINSPGGSVVASELMHDEIEHFRDVTGQPVIAVLMDVAASGAYYIACGCDEIVAQPSTVTGSIGVMMQMFEFSGTLRKIGVTTDAITSGPHKDSGSPLRAMKPEERRVFQGIVDEMYERFVQVVADGRPGLDKPAVRKLADGRVYTAHQALELGLIDRIATLRDVIACTKKRVGSERIRVVAYKRPSGYRPNYYAENQPILPGDVNLLKIDLQHWLEGNTPGFYYLWCPGR